MTEKETERILSGLATIVRTAKFRFTKGSAQAFNDDAALVDGVDWNDPFEELARREEEAEEQTALSAIALVERTLKIDSLPEVLIEEIREIAVAQFRQYEETFMEWLFAAGPHPLEVMRRLFAYVKTKRASLLYNMGFRQLGPLLGESHANTALRCQTLFPNVPAGWKKPASSCEKMAEAAKGNNNRRGGKKVRKD